MEVEKSLRLTFLCLSSASLRTRAILTWALRCCSTRFSSELSCCSAKLQICASSTFGFIAAKLSRCRAAKGSFAASGRYRPWVKSCFTFSDWNKDIILIQTLVRKSGKIRIDILEGLLAIETTGPYSLQEQLWLP